jgi:hypothetical protein
VALRPNTRFRDPCTRKSSAECQAESAPDRLNLTHLGRKLEDLVGLINCLHTHLDPRTPKKVGRARRGLDSATFTRMTRR